MAKRKRIGFLFSYDEEWIGGTYYILNVIQAFKTLQQVEKPVITILSSKKSDFELVKNETNYPFLKFEQFPRKLLVIERVINKITRTILKKDVFHLTSKLSQIDFVYPNYSDRIKNKSIKKTYWIPDFQEEFLPEYFSKEEISARKNHQKNIAKNADFLVFSSENAQSHYNQLYPISKPKQFVLPFAVTHPDYKTIKIEELLVKYDLPPKYFFTPNQFWAHKNHITVLKAVKLLKEQGKEICVAFSGKETDNRNQDHIDYLKQFIKTHGLTKNIKFLGFLDRAEQLQLMNHSIAIVQPSLFEGWSTVVEDAKSLGKFVIASDLDVHKEQLDTTADFFSSKNEKELSLLLEKYWGLEVSYKQTNDYDQSILKFANNFLELVKKATE